MSCPKTEYLIQEYFADDLTPLAREKMESHLHSCEHCTRELETLLVAQSNLNQWQDQRVPHWDRGLELFRREHRVPNTGNSFWNKLQWLPTAASLAMLAILLLNVNIVASDEGFSISFGGGNSDAAYLDSRLITLEQDQQAAMDALVQRVEDRQDTNNIELLQAVMDQTQQTTAENLDRIYAFFEQQRLQDLEDMRVGYQELVDSDYATIRSLQQIAQFVSYQGDVR
ncbi:MAG: zf-HC2 domain-containing protein [Gammaproteobacteria bacterium]|nr:zf-HC2 domain-containing protein [Gammaproteobacteria bacterium]MDD9894434.1 zf-HC2 domain-containing protein [Gammaproteobacteria bacterium]MDD9958647.1 zf-HC2 domain-containing protein [Gammaproteobacteria bacterium]